VVNARVAQKLSELEGLLKLKGKGFSKNIFDDKVAIGQSILKYYRKSLIY
jgi:hypothetical protein